MTPYPTPNLKVGRAKSHQASLLGGLVRNGAVMAFAVVPLRMMDRPCGGTHGRRMGLGIRGITLGNQPGASGFSG